MKDFRTIHPRDTLCRILYGVALPPLEPEMRLRMVKATMVIAAADGELSEPEWEQVVAIARMLEMPDAQIEALSQFDFKNVPLEELLPERTRWPAVARVALYNAVQTASADQHYHEREKAAVAHAARILGVTPDVVALIEDLVAQDLLARQTRSHVLFPGLVGAAK